METPDKKLAMQAHLGLGDLIWCVGAIRYFSKLYQEVLVVCFDYYEEQFNLLFADLPNVKPLPVPRGDIYLSYETTDYTVMLAGDYIRSVDKIPCSFTLYPDCFYIDFGLDPSIRTTHFYIPRPIDSVQVSEHKYIFVTLETSIGTLETHQDILNTNMLIINPNKNMYEPGHMYYEEANKYLNKPSIIHYMDVIENAEELHMVDSSFLCLASQLDLSKVKVKKCYMVRSYNVDNLGIFEITHVGWKEYVDKNLEKLQCW